MNYNASIWPDETAEMIKDVLVTLLVWTELKMFWFLAGENEWFFSLVDALGQMDGMCKCINVIRGAHNLMHKQRNLNDSTQPLWLGEEELAKKMVFKLER